MSGLVNDTIIALASAPVASALAIFRVSGPSTKRILKNIIGFLPVNRVSTLAKFRSSNNKIFDKGLVVFFQGPKSFTGEDLCEFQVHGGLGVIKILMDTCLSQSFPNNIVRFAEPGEFSKRAYLNGKMCLHEAEAISDLINAESEAKVDAINKILDQSFGKAILLLSDFIIDTRAELEARINFSEDETGFFQAAPFVKNVEKKLDWLKDTIEAAQKGEALSHKHAIAIIGNTNVGKSTLMNRLLEKDVSIIHKLAGTTRDIIRSTLVLGNLQIEFFDTAGIRDTKNEVEAEGIRRGLLKAQTSNLVLFCINTEGLNNSKLQEAQEFLLSQQIAEQKVIFVFTKVDLYRERTAEKRSIPHLKNAVSISAKTGEGIIELREMLLRHFHLSENQDNDTEIIFLKKRSVDNLVECHRILTACVENAKTNSLDLVAEDLRLAQVMLSEITGKISNEQVLGKIFSKFCIGK